MDVHVRAVAILHIIFGALTLVGIALVGLFFGAFVALVQPDLPFLAVFASLGAVVAVPYAMLAIAQVVAAVYMLRGSTAAKPWVLVFGVLSLLSFPLGTAVGGYTLWVLLRQLPVPPAPPHPGAAGA